MHQMTQVTARAASRNHTTDPRWQALGIVQAAMEPLALRDRDIAVLRGLLSFVPADRWDGPLVVYASNAALQGRCDGIDERTLRRRLARLSELGLIRRNQSPNRKRYVVRDETGEALLTYGFDLAPLREALTRLQALGEEHRHLQKAIAARKSLLRDRLYRLSQPGFRPETDTETLAELSRLLRRKTSLTELEQAVATAETLLGMHEQPVDKIVSSDVLTDSHGQNDRHIQSSDKEYLERRSAAEIPPSPVTQPDTDMTLATCIEAAPASVEFAQSPPKSWSDLSTLAHQLAPAIGVDAPQMHRARSVLGERGAVLAILGLVEAYPRIREPKRYLNTLLTRAISAGLNMDRMFRSLTGWARFPAGNRPLATL